MNAILRSLRSRKTRMEIREIPELEPPDQFLLESDRHFMYQNPSQPLNTHTHSLIDNLPSEILEMIFLSTQTGISPWAPEFRKWIYCTHVSRRWRRVSLAFRHLWTSVDTTCGLIAFAFIRRSKNAPLTLRIDLRPKTSWLECQTINLALTHISRTRELHLRVEGVGELTKISTPLLQIGLQTSLEVLEVQSVVSFEFPHDIFKQAHGSLRSLTIANVCSPYPPALLHNITRLHIFWTRYPGPPHLASFLNILDQCTNIVEFQFCSTMRWELHQMNLSAHHSQRILCLPHLQRLSLINPSSSVVILLLNHLTLPTINSLKISSCGYDNLRGIPCILPAFTSLYDSCCVAMSDDDLHVVLTHMTNHRPTMDVRLRLPAYKSENMMSQNFDAFRSVIPAGSPLLKSLCFSFSFPTVAFGIKPYPTTYWTSLLQSLPNLDELKFSAFYGNGTCDQTAVTLLDALSSETKSGGYICPTLRRISFANISLRPGMTMKELDSSNALISANGGKLGHRSFNYSLWAFVISRGRQHMRLEKLDISECQHVGAPLLDSLAPYVDEILPKVGQIGSAIS